MHKVIIYGTRDLAELAHFYLTSDSEYEVVALRLTYQAGVPILQQV